jgi:hypothetical protein
MAATAHTRVPRLEDFVGRSKRACANRAWVAEAADVDEDTVLRWAKGQEPIPDDVIDWLADSLGFSVTWMMRWDDAPRSEIPERWRQAIAEDGAQRCEQQLPHECESLLHWIELRLRVDADLDESLLVPRLQRLRAAVLEYLSEPCEL